MTPQTTRMLAAAMACARRQARTDEQAATLLPTVQVEHNQITVRGVKLTDEEMDVLRAIADRMKLTTTGAREAVFSGQKETTCS